MGSGGNRGSHDSQVTSLTRTEIIREANHQVIRMLHDSTEKDLRDMAPDHWSVADVDAIANEYFVQVERVRRHLDAN